MPAPRSLSRPLKILIATVAQLRSAIAHHTLLEMRMVRCSRLALLCSAVAVQCRASDHLDSPTVIADPRTDIGDVYAWMSPDHQRTEPGDDYCGALVLRPSGLCVPRGQWSEVWLDDFQHRYCLPICPRWGFPRYPLGCRSHGDGLHRWQGRRITLMGTPSVARGLQSRHRRFRVFAGLRDDPFFNNVRGTPAA